MSLKRNTRGGYDELKDAFALHKQNFETLNMSISYMSKFEIEDINGEISYIQI